MAFKHNQQTFYGDELAYKHMTQVDFGDPFASSGYRQIPEKETIPAVWPGVDLKFEKMTTASPKRNYGSAMANTADLLAINSNGESVRTENSKRPNNDDQAYQVGCKRTRQLDSGKPSSRGTCDQSCTLEFKSRKDPSVPEDSTKNSHGSFYSFPSFTCGKNKEDMRLEVPTRLSSFPGYYEDYNRATGSDQIEEIHSPVFCYPRRKLVSLGHNHQADVPVWRPKCFKSSPGGSDKHDASTSVTLLINDVGTDKWTKFCVMPMPDSNTQGFEGLVGRGKNDCYCLDEGSIRCIKQHVIEAREKLRLTLGQKCFVELGFCNMGEDVALRWTEEEEQLFCEIVESNLASLGRNFWNVLHQAFPYRGSKELVSYYFNVFILRKRAEQNRSDPSNVDSDNDEWQDSDSDDGDFGTTGEEDDEDSGVESPADDVTQHIRGLGEVDIHEEAEGDECDDECSHVQPIGKNTFEGHDVHDDSCTSYEDQYNGADSGGRVGTCDNLLEDDHGNLHGEYRNHDGMSGMTDHEYIVDLCGPRPWEIGYARGVDKDIDFLPTCNMIEEVFGHESWESEKKDSQGIS
ncbi:uncharacterized protein M6B38_283230 [Iris pallida]|uniref:Myb-like domain-containing protein n=1 Tax=Iris pallida TaxID=29817 RepID=A0AAX6I0K6_IRIPA|nr:uncharacterized protein M6B38_283230 [Iris pallida]